MTLLKVDCLCTNSSERCSSLGWKPNRPVGHFWVSFCIILVSLTRSHDWDKSFYCWLFLYDYVLNCLIFLPSQIQSTQKHHGVDLPRKLSQNIVCFVMTLSQVLILQSDNNKRYTFANLNTICISTTGFWANVVNWRLTDLVFWSNG